MTVVQVRDAQRAEPAAIAAVADLDGQRVLEVGREDGRLTRFAVRHALEIYAFDPNGDRVAEAAVAVAAEDVTAFASACTVLTRSMWSAIGSTWR